MTVPSSTLALIGFGEAAMAFVEGMGETRPSLRAYDIKTGVAETRDAKLADYARHRVEGCETSAAALLGAQAVLSLVTADQALAAASEAGPALSPGLLYFDMNSVAPATKRAAARLVENAGARYVDVAVLAPVRPLLTRVPLLVSGPHAEAGAAMLRSIGFDAVQVVEGAVGAASAVKMIRSVIVKGIEALSAECALAAAAAGVTDAVIASLDASWPGADWRTRFDYNLDRMLVHGLRRAAEMEEVVKTLAELGAGSTMTQGTVECQRAVGELRLSPPQGLEAKVALILDRKAAAA